MHLDRQSLEKAKHLIQSGLIDTIEVGTIKGLQEIHRFYLKGCMNLPGKSGIKIFRISGSLIACIWI